MKKILVAIVAVAMLLLVPLELANARGDRRGGRGRGMDRGTSDRSSRVRNRRNSKDRQKLADRTRSEDRKAALDRLSDTRG